MFFRNGQKQLEVFMNRNIIIIVLILFNVLIRLEFFQFPFWGLEYEDSFIFNDASRQLAYDYPHDATPWKTLSCSNGSLNECYEHSGYGGHFLTYPIAIAFVTSFVGYTTFNAGLTSFIFSIIIILCLFRFMRKRNLNDELNFLLILFLATPLLPVFNTSGLAETTSGLFVLLFFLNYIKLIEANFNLKVRFFWLTIVFFIIAIITKRENLAIFIFTMVFPFVNLIFRKQKSNWLKYISHLFLLGFFGFIFSELIGLNSIESNEGEAIQTATFSIDFFIINLGQLFKAMFIYSYWGITGALFILSIVVFAIRRKMNLIPLGSITITIIFIIVYSSHYRSYYQVHYNLIDPFETLRYSVNYLPVLILFIASSGILSFFSIKWIQERNWFKPVIFVLLIGILTPATLHLRRFFSEDEYIARIEPVIKTIEISNENDLIITDIPIVFNCYVAENQKIIDLYSLNKEKLLYEIENVVGDIYIVKEIDSDINFLRYKMDFSESDFCTQTVDKKLLHYEILRICK